ncbi:probable serine/threonine-protein kinase DDB_G0282963 [Cydia pomonella]|uniref:probable serine/threonine-protein kinase DDB_G0282963 n=1 Tax=Cydia pomonella TaxID=82600 RepID=UPI002ADD5669|nr:probable serine/threonine-protein kinase DDB_G0282963 [Cydia pomonella]
MYYFCAICMINTETLLDLNPKCRRLFEGMVSPYIEVTECLKYCRILLCRDCNRLLCSMLMFQQTVVKGVTNLIALYKRSNMIYHNLPDVINANTDVMLPVVNEEVVCTTNSIFTKQPAKGAPRRTAHMYDFSKPSIRSNMPIPKTIKRTPPVLILRKRLLETNKTPPRKRKRQNKTAERKEQDLDSTLSFDSDCCFSGDPGYVRLVATEQMDHEYINTNTNDMAVLVPIQDTRDERESTNTNTSSEVKKKLNRDLYQAVQLAVESRSMSDFDIDQYEPESDLDHAFESGPESHHDLKSPHHDSKSSHHDLNSPHHNSKSSYHDFNTSHHESKSPHHDINSPHHESKQSHYISKSSHNDLNSSHNDLNSSHHASKSSHHDSNTSHYETNSSHHVLNSPPDHSKSTHHDSKLTLSCESDYEDAEHYPNIMLAKVFSGVTKREVSEDIQKKLHLTRRKSSNHDLNSPHYKSKSSHHDLKLSHYDLNSPHHETNSSHHDLNSPRLGSKSSHQESKSSNHDSKSSHHDLESSPNSELTLSCESDYEDAENYPNIMLAKAFSGVTEGEVSEDIQKTAHLVLDPPSEWPCTVDRCYGHTQHTDSSDSDVIADEDTRLVS